MSVSEFLKDKKCVYCNAKAETVLFGQILCGSDDCIEKARLDHVCVGKMLRESDKSG